MVILAVGLRLVTRAEFFTPRHTAFMFVPTFVLIGVVLSGRYGAVLRFLLVPLAAFAMFGSWIEFRGLEKTGDWDGVARYIESRERPGEVILVWRPDTVLAFEHEYEGEGRVAGFPRGPDLTEPFSDAWGVRDEEELWDRIRDLGSPDRFWLVMYGDEYLGRSYGREIMESWLARCARVYSCQVFGGRTAVYEVELEVGNEECRRGISESCVRGSERAAYPGCDKISTHKPRKGQEGVRHHEREYW
jgi:hypothetical protein